MTLRGRYVVRITPADVGRRVTIRSRIGASDRQPAMTDTVGVLRAWTEGVLRVERRDGELVEIRDKDMVAGRVIAASPWR